MLPLSSSGILSCDNSRRLSDACPCLQIKTSLGKIMACNLLSGNPLSQLVLYYCQVHTSRQISIKFELNYNNLHTRKYCSKTCLVTLLICLSLHGKNCTRASAWVQFFQCNEKINLLFIRAMTLWIMLMNKKFKAWTLYRNPIGNWHRVVFISHALNMSCSFGTSGCSIESRCMVRNIICKMLSIFSQLQCVNREISWPIPYQYI